MWVLWVVDDIVVSVVGGHLASAIHSHQGGQSPQSRDLSMLDYAGFRPSHVIRP